MAKRGYESQKTGRKVDELLDKIDNLNVPEWALQESKPSYTAQEVHALPENTSIPKKTSDLTNDMGYISHESDPTVPLWAKQPTKPEYTAQEVGALPSNTPLFSGDYNDLRNKPAIPTVPENVSAFNNDAGYLTDEDMGDYATKQELNGKQDTINDLGSIRSGASAGATAYQKPQAGIPESDLSQGVKDKMNEKEVFWATYGSTTLQEIKDAYNAGKVVLCSTAGCIYTISNLQSSYCYFGAINSTSSTITSKYLLHNGSSWSNGNLQAEKIGNKVSAFQTTPDNTHYPSEKLVKESLDAKADLSSMAKWGVVSQTQTWTQASDGGYDYTMSDLQYGWIPQANIDLYESAGAVFNETSGYFELNGLTDISYEEMKDVYEAPRATMIPNGLTRLFQSAQVRTTIPYKTNNNYGGLGSLGAVSTCNGSYLEVLAISKRHNGTEGDVRVGGMNYFAANSYHLKKIIGKIWTDGSKGSQDFNSAFTACKSLEEIHLYRVGKDITFDSSPRLRADCIAEMINNCLNETITITLHPTAYARAIADSDVQAALQAHTNVSLASA